MKKIISFILVTLMVLTALPLASIASLAATDIAKIGSVGYASLDAAIKAVKNGETITVLADCEISSHMLGANGISYTIDGSNKAYTIKAKCASTSDYVKTYNNNVTYKNAKIQILNTYENSQGHSGTITFDNCVITADIAAMRHCGTGTFTFKNGTQFTGSSQTPLLFLRTNSKGKIVVDNSTLTQAAGANNNHTGNNSVIHINNSAKVADMTYDIELKNGAKLVNACATTDANTCPSVATVIRVESPEVVLNITASSDSELVLNSKAPKLSSSEFISFFRNKSASARITLNGTPKFIASSYVVSKGVYMPDIIIKSGSVRYTNTWSANGTTLTTWTDVTTQNKYTATVSGDVTFTPVDTKLTAANAAAGVRKYDGVIEYYATFDEAKSRIHPNEAFVFIKDYSYTATTNILSGLIGDSKVLVYTIMGVPLDGDKKITLTLPSSSGNDYYYVGVRHVTFENLNLISNYCFDTDQAKTGGSLTFKDCDVTINNDFRITNANTINIINTTITSTHNSPMFYIRNNAEQKQGVINVQDSHLKYAGNGTSPNSCIFHVNGTYAVAINVNGSSTLEWNGSGASSAHIMYVEKSTDPVVLTMQNSATLYLNGKTATTGDNYFFKGNTNTEVFKSEFRIKGTPTYKVNANVAAGGFTFLADNCKNMNTGLLGYSTNGKIYKNVVATTTTTEDLVFVTVAFTNNDFALINGAEVREGAIRFSAKIDKDFLSLVGNSAKFGMIIAHKDLVAGQEITLEMANSEFKPTIAFAKESNSSKWEKDSDGNSIYRMALTNVPMTPSAYVTEVSARGYMTITFEDGSTETFYTAFGDVRNTRSIYSVAYKLERANKGSDITQAIGRIVLSK